MMPLLSPVVLALSWGLVSALQTVQGAVSSDGGAPVAVLPVPLGDVPNAIRTAGESLGLGNFDFSVSPHTFTLDLLAAQPPSWPEAPDAADKESSPPNKPTPTPGSIVMWFGVIGATILILPRFRRR